MKLLPRRTTFQSSLIPSSPHECCEPLLALRPRGAAQKHGHRVVESAASTLRKWTPSGLGDHYCRVSVSARVVNAESVADLVDRVLWDARLRERESEAFLSSVAVAGVSSVPQSQCEAFVIDENLVQEQRPSAPSSCSPLGCLSSRSCDSRLALGALRRGISASCSSTRASSCFPLPTSIVNARAAVRVHAFVDDVADASRSTGHVACVGRNALHVTKLLLGAVRSRCAVAHGLVLASLASGVTHSGLATSNLKGALSLPGYSDVVGMTSCAVAPIAETCSVCPGAEGFAVSGHDAAPAMKSSALLAPSFDETHTLCDVHEVTLPAIEVGCSARDEFLRRIAFREVFTVARWMELALYATYSAASADSSQPNFFVDAASHWRDAVKPRVGLELPLPILPVAIVTSLSTQAVAPVPERAPKRLGTHKRRKPGGVAIDDTPADASVQQSAPQPSIAQSVLLEYETWQALLSNADDHALASTCVNSGNSTPRFERVSMAALGLLGVASSIALYAANSREAPALPPDAMYTDVTLTADSPMIDVDELPMPSTDAFFRIDTALVEPEVSLQVRQCYRLVPSTHSLLGGTLLHSIPWHVYPGPVDSFELMREGLSTCKTIHPILGPGDGSSRVPTCADRCEKEYNPRALPRIVTNVLLGGCLSQMHRRRTSQPVELAWYPDSAVVIVAPDAVAAESSWRCWRGLIRRIFQCKAAAVSQLASTSILPQNVCCVASKHTLLLSQALAARLAESLRSSFRERATAEVVALAAHSVGGPQSSLRSSLQALVTPSPVVEVDCLQHTRSHTAPPTSLSIVIPAVTHSSKHTSPGHSHALTQAAEPSARAVFASLRLPLAHWLILSDRLASEVMLPLIQGRVWPSRFADGPIHGEASTQTLAPALVVAETLPSLWALADVSCSEIHAAATALRRARKNAQGVLDAAVKSLKAAVRKHKRQNSKGGAQHLLRDDSSETHSLAALETAAVTAADEVAAASARIHSCAIVAHTLSSVLERGSASHPETAASLSSQVEYIRSALALPAYTRYLLPAHTSAIVALLGSIAGAAAAMQQAQRVAAIVGAAQGVTEPVLLATTRPILFATALSQPNQTMGDSILSPQTATVDANVVVPPCLPQPARTAGFLACARERAASPPLLPPASCHDSTCATDPAYPKSGVCNSSPLVAVDLPRRVATPCQTSAPVAALIAVTRPLADVRSNVSVFGGVAAFDLSYSLLVPPSDGRVQHSDNGAALAQVHDESGASVLPGYHPQSSTKQLLSCGAVDQALHCNRGSSEQKAGFAAAASGAFKFDSRLASTVAALHPTCSDHFSDTIAIPRSGDTFGVPLHLRRFCTAAAVSVAIQAAMSNHQPEMRRSQNQQKLLHDSKYDCMPSPRLCDDARLGPGSGAIVRSSAVPSGKWGGQTATSASAIAANNLNADVSGPLPPVALASAAIAEDSELVAALEGAHGGGFCLVEYLGEGTQDHDASAAAILHRLCLAPGGVDLLLDAAQGVIFVRFSQALQQPSPKDAIIAALERCNILGGGFVETLHVVVLLAKTPEIAVGHIVAQAAPTSSTARHDRGQKQTGRFPSMRSAATCTDGRVSTSSLPAQCPQSPRWTAADISDALSFGITSTACFSFAVLWHVFADCDSDASPPPPRGLGFNAAAPVARPISGAGRAALFLRRAADARCSTWVRHRFSLVFGTSLAAAAGSSADLSGADAAMHSADAASVLAIAAERLVASYRSASTLPVAVIASPLAHASWPDRSSGNSTRTISAASTLTTAAVFLARFPPLNPIAALALAHMLMGQCGTLGAGIRALVEPNASSRVWDELAAGVVPEMMLKACVALLCGGGRYTASEPE